MGAGLAVIFVNHRQKVHTPSDQPPTPPPPGSWVFLSGGEHAQGIKHLYSAHSWLGIAVAGFFALQGLQGMVVFLGVGGGAMTSSVRRAVLPLHRGVGVALYYIALLTICLVRVCRPAPSSVLLSTLPAAERTPTPPLQGWWNGAVERPARVSERLACCYSIRSVHPVSLCSLGMSSPAAAPDQRGSLPRDGAL